MKTIDDLEVAGRRVLLRADLNVPLDRRIRPTAHHRRRPHPGQPAGDRKLSARGAKVIILAHLGRPKGGDYAERPRRPVAGAGGGPAGRAAGQAGGLRHRRGRRVRGRDRGRAGRRRRGAAGERPVRRRPRPARTTPSAAQLAGRLAALGDLYVGDGFGAVHRKHASVYDLPPLLPHAAGDLVRAEVDVLSRLTARPSAPYVVVLGGAKVVGQARRDRQPAGPGRPAS